LRKKSWLRYGKRAPLKQEVRPMAHAMTHQPAIPHFTIFCRARSRTHGDFNTQEVIVGITIRIIIINEMRGERGGLLFMVSSTLIRYHFYVDGNIKKLLMKVSFQLKVS
jgi:hypothetical protein